MCEAIGDLSGGRLQPAAKTRYGGEGMGKVRRVYVEKQEGFGVQAQDLKNEISSYLGIRDVENVRVLIRYDVENLSDETFKKACRGVFAEPPVDL